MLPSIRPIAGDAYMFQHVRQMVEILHRETPTFIAPDLWPPNSPHLNPVDYRYEVLCRIVFIRRQFET